MHQTTFTYISLILSGMPIITIFALFTLMIIHLKRQTGKPLLDTDYDGTVDGLVAAHGTRLAQMEDIEDFQDRPYQQKIIDVCIQKNSVVYLPTESVKSFITIQVIRRFSKELERTYLSGGKRSVFICSTTQIAKQQAETVEEILHYNISLLTEEQGVDSWNAAKWSIILDENHILVATPQVILDALSHSFDECHHGRNNHPYKEIMMLFDGNEETRIVGLSGILIGVNKSIKSYKV